MCLPSRMTMILSLPWMVNPFPVDPRWGIGVSILSGVYMSVLASFIF